MSELKRMSERVDSKIGMEDEESTASLTWRSAISGRFLWGKGNLTDSREYAVSEREPVSANGQRNGEWSLGGPLQGHSSNAFSPSDRGDGRDTPTTSCSTTYPPFELLPGEELNRTTVPEVEMSLLA